MNTLTFAALSTAQIIIYVILLFILLVLILGTVIYITMQNRVLQKQVLKAIDDALDQFEDDDEEITPSEEDRIAEAKFYNEASKDMFKYIRSEMKNFRDETVALDNDQAENN